MYVKREVALELDMLAMDTGPRSPLLRSSPLEVSGSIRNAEQRDLAQVARLLEASGIDLRAVETDPRRSLPRCHLLVLDIDGAVRAAAYLVIARARGLRGRLEFLVLDPALPRGSTRAIQDRMTGVTVALCEAYGCADVDIAATSRNDVAAPRQVLAACVG
jgi:hypothetical protein